MPMPLCPHRKYKTNKILICDILFINLFNYEIVHKVQHKSNIKQYKYTYYNLQLKFSYNFTSFIFIQDALIITNPSTLSDQK